MCPASFGYDNKFGWDNYVLTLPYTKKQIVFSKYLFGLLLMGVCTAIGILINYIFVLFGVAVFGSDSVSIAVGIVSTTVIMIGIMVPLIYRFGAEKAQAAIVVISVAGFMLLARGFMWLQQAGMRQFLDSTVMLLPFIAALVLLCSYFITCRIYQEERQEYKQVKQFSKLHLK